MKYYLKRPVTIDAVKITSADYNGIDWDGSPFSETPDWLIGAFKAGVIKPIHNNDLDYSLWKIEGYTELGYPGDYVIWNVLLDRIELLSRFNFEKMYEPLDGWS